MKERSIRTLWLSLLMVCFFVAGIFSISMSVKAADTDSSAPEVPGLTFESEMQNDFAECFHIYYYNDDYTLQQKADFIESAFCWLYTNMHANTRPK